MIFIRYEQLAEDVQAWSEQLPQDIDAFIGLPRSGMIPAAMLALQRNVRLSTVAEMSKGHLFTGGFRDQHRSLKKVMVVDDSILSGKSLLRAKAMLKEFKKVEILYGGVYLNPKFDSKYLHYKALPLPRIFQWNWLHHFWLQHSCVDIDGVLCHDPTRQENDDGIRYHQFLTNARPRHIPRVQIHTIVTSRLEKYRQETIGWLLKHGISYKKLVMHPAKSGKERRQCGDHAARKAKTYQSQEYKLFIESSEHQAQAIHNLTGKPVLCTDIMTMFA